MSQPDEVAAARVSTWELLPTLGFREVPPGSYSVSPELAYDFGNLKLSANALIGQSLQPVVLFQGVLASPRTVAEVRFELPQQVESADEALAMLAYYLDSASRGNPKLAVEPMWVSEGRSKRHLLPWEKDRIAYAARPHCYVARDWVRVALKKLAEQIDHAPADTATVFSFDGTVLKIRCGDLFVAMPAEGQAWKQAFTIPLGSLRELPTRLTSTNVGFEVWNATLVIGNRRFNGVEAVELIRARQCPVCQDGGPGEAI